MTDVALRAADIAKLLKNLAIETREFVQQALAPISTKQAELEQRLAELERQQVAAKNESDAT
jgi:hypothetical protein